MASPSVTVYTSSTAVSLKTKKDQQAVRFLLEKKGCLFDEIDIARDPTGRNELKQKFPDHALPFIIVHRETPLTYTTEQLLALEEDDQLSPILE